MRVNRRRIFAVCLICLLPWAAHAAAPVVDESDNFATFDQNQAADDQPLVTEHEQSERRNNDFPDNDFVESQPLAHESKYASSGNDAALLSQVQSMQKEIQELRGQLEVQSHELKLLKEQQLTFYKDIDARLHQTSTTTQPTNVKPTDISPASAAAVSAEKTIPTPGHSARSSNPADEQIQYLAAYDLIKNKRFNDAITAMQTFVIQYPNGGYTANAHYWLGELYMTQKDFDKANAQFDIVLTQFPSSNKAAPSLLKSAFALSSSGKKQEAIARLKKVIKQYPDTQPAKMAEEKLRSLNR